MHFVDYTHPEKVPALRLPLDRRSAQWYLRLTDLPMGHPFHSYLWHLFRYPEWLEGGAAWLQAKFIAEDLETFRRLQNIEFELRPVVGSADPMFDEALAQALITFGLRPLVAEVFVRNPDAS